MLAALLLAAGASTRFGSDKLLAHLGGQPLVRWSAAAMLTAPVSDVVVVCGPGPDADALREALDGLPVRFAVNPEPARGMGSSIASGVAALPHATDAVLVALADQPRPSASALQRVVDRYRAGGVSIIAPSFRGVPGHPVLFARDVFGELLELSGDRGARAVVERAPSRVAIIEVDEDAPRDVDVPADLDVVDSGD